MKHIKILLFVGLLAGVVMTSCENMMDVKSDRFVTAEENTLDNPNDTLYSMFGILAKMQNLGDQYIILGEMRGDLMDVTVNSDAELRELSSLDVSEDNSWIDVSNYYVVINHCNYYINNVDTSLFLGGTKVMMKEYAAAKVIRAWVYLQMALNYGEAYYVTEPILTVEEAMADQNLLSKDAILDSLIVELLEVENLSMPSLVGSISGYSYSSLFPSAKYLLGEIYLWQNKYELAATKYYESILEDSRTVGSHYRNYWVSQSGFLNKMLSWPMLFSDNSEMSARIAYYYTETLQKSVQPKIPNMTIYDYTIAPSQRALNLFENQVYTDMVGDNIITTGDLRGDGSSYEYMTEVSLQSLSSSASVYGGDLITSIKPQVGDPLIYIYTYSDAAILQRTSVAYLRYAEAVNRLNKPTWALAVINYGLSYETRIDSTKVNQAELTGETWLDFDRAMFTSNYGMRKRGMGESTVVTFPPELTTMEDSVNYVESIIVEELALETAFEGNRFQDLMRISQHNPDGQNDVIASAIALKYESNYDAVYAKMQNPSNWYLPFPKVKE